MEQRNPYHDLGIDPGASPGEIKRAYLQLVRQYTPERHPEEFKRIRAAYEQLKDEHSRASTDVFHLNLDDDRLAGCFGQTPVPAGDLTTVDLLQVLYWASDLGRTDFSGDFTRFPWEEDGKTGEDGR